MAAVRLAVELRDPQTTPVYQRIAAEAAAMQDRGVTVATIARYVSSLPECAPRRHFYPEGVAGPSRVEAGPSRVEAGSGPGEGLG